MRSKKVLVLLLTLCFTLSIVLAGCGSSSQSAGSSAASSAASSQASKKEEVKPIVLKLAHNLPTTHPDTIGFKKIAKEVEEKSNGRLIIKDYPAEQLGKEKDYMDTVSNDSGDMGSSGPGELARRYKPVMIFDAPYIFRDMQHLLNTANGPVGTELWNELASKTNIRVLTTIYYGTRYVTTSKVPAKNPTEMNGLKLRTPDQPMAFRYGQALGAKPTPMSLGEVYLALQQGVVDGQENPIPTIDSFKFSEVQKYLIKTGHVIACTTLTISDKKFKALPADLQKILVDVVNSNSKLISQAVADEENSKLDSLKKAGMQVVEPDVAAFKKACEPIYKEYENEWGKGLYEKIQAVK